MTRLDIANRKANSTFSIWRGIYKAYQRGYVSVDKLDKAELIYHIAEHERQEARKEAGLVYLTHTTTQEQTPEIEHCCICGCILEYMEQRYRWQGKVYCPHCAFDTL